MAVVKSHGRGDIAHSTYLREFLTVFHDLGLS